MTIAKTFLTVGKNNFFSQCTHNGYIVFSLAELVLVEDKYNEIYLSIDFWEILTFERKIFMFSEVIQPSGLIAIPDAIKKILGVSDGDKINFVVENNSVKIVNPAIQAMKVIQEEMAGEAEKANLNSEEDILQLVKEVRDEDFH
jgi:antitoxin component of MazEF toxin-antitoxin module